MTHRLRVVAVLVLSALAPGGVGGGPSLRPWHAVGAAQDEPVGLDFAAMALVPSDLPGSEFGSDASWLRTDLGDGLADPALTAYLVGKDSGVVSHVYGTDGWQRDYGSRLARPKPGDPDNFARTVTTFLAEFGDAHNAHLAFVDLWAVAPGVTSGTPAATPRAIGDETVLRAKSGRSGGIPVAILAKVFRADNVLGGVIVADFVGQPPSAPEVEFLASVVSARVAAVRRTGGPGLGPRVLRIHAGDLTPGSDEYELHGGVYEPFYGQTSPADRATRITYFGTATDVYSAFQYFPAMPPLEAGPPVRRAPNRPRARGRVGCGVLRGGDRGPGLAALRVVVQGAHRQHRDGHRTERSAPRPGRCRRPTGGDPGRLSARADSLPSCPRPGQLPRLAQGRTPGGNPGREPSGRATNYPGHGR